MTTLRQLRFAVPFALLAIVLAPSRAQAGNKEDAKALVAKASKAHKDGRYDEARIDLEAAYALDPRPDLLYALGQTHAKLGNCREATGYYKRFAATQRDPQVTRVVDQAIAACQPAGSSAPAPTAAPAADQAASSDRRTATTAPAADRAASSDQRTSSTGAPPEPAAVPLASRRPGARAASRQPFGPSRTAPAPVSPAEAPPWYNDKLGDGLVLGGIAAGVIGLIEYRAALADLDAAENRATAPNQARYRELLDSAGSKRTTSLILFAAGGALITSGVVRFVLHDRTTEVPIALVPARGGGVLSYEGSF